MLKAVNAAVNGMGLGLPNEINWRKTAGGKLLTDGEGEAGGPQALKDVGCIKSMLDSEACKLTGQVEEGWRLGPMVASLYAAHAAHNRKSGSDYTVVLALKCAQEPLRAVECSAVVCSNAPAEVMRAMIASLEAGANFGHLEPLGGLDRCPQTQQAASGESQGWQGWVPRADGTAGAPMAGCAPLGQSEGRRAPQAGCRRRGRGDPTRSCAAEWVGETNGWKYPTAGSWLVRQGMEQGGQTQVFLNGEVRRLAVWEVARELLADNGSGLESLVLVESSDEITAEAALRCLGRGELKGHEKVWPAEGDAVALEVAIGSLAAAATWAPLVKAVLPGGASTGLQRPATGNRMLGAVGAGPIATPGPAERRTATPPPPGSPRPSAATTGGGYLDEGAMTGYGHRPALPRSGVLPAVSMEAYYGKDSVFSNLDESHGSFQMVVSLLPQIVLNALGHDLVQVLMEVGSLRSVEFGLHFFKFLLHNRARSALELLEEVSVWAAMKKSKARGWGFDWQLWESVAYEVLLGLLRMKALAHPTWMEKVARHSRAYFVEASPSNSNFGAGHDFRGLGQVEMRKLGKNFAGEGLNTINDEHRRAVHFVPSSMPVLGSPAVPWYELNAVSPPLERRRDLGERARHYHAGEEERRSRSARPRSQSPAQGQGPWGHQGRSEARAQSPSWSAPRPMGEGRMEKMARRSLSPRMLSEDNGRGGGYGGAPPQWSQPACFDGRQMPGQADQAQYGQPYGVHRQQPPPPMPFRAPMMIPPPPPLGQTYTMGGDGAEWHGGGRHVGSFAQGDMHWQGGMGDGGWSPGKGGVPTESARAGGAAGGQGGTAPALRHVPTAWWDATGTWCGPGVPPSPDIVD